MSSARERKTGVIQPRSSGAFDDHAELLEAVQFAKDESSPPLTAVFDDDVAALDRVERQRKLPPPVDVVKVARRLAMKRELQELAKLADLIPKAHPRLPPAPADASSSALSVRDSLVTVPPSVRSVPPPPPPPAPVASSPHRAVPAPSAPAAPPDRDRLAGPPSRPPSVPPPLPSIPPPPIAPSFAPASVPSQAAERVSRFTWAALVSSIGIALPSGLILGHALTSHPVPAAAAGASRGAAWRDPTHGPGATEPVSAAPAMAAAASPGGPQGQGSAPGVLTITESADPSLLVRAPRPAHHGRSRSSPKSAPTAPAGDDAATAPPSAATW